MGCPASVPVPRCVVWLEPGRLAGSPHKSLDTGLDTQRTEQAMSQQPGPWDGPSNQNFWSRNGEKPSSLLYSSRCQQLVCQDVLGTSILHQHGRQQCQGMFDQSSELSGPQQHSLQEPDQFGGSRLQYLATKQRLLCMTRPLTVSSNLRTGGLLMQCFMFTIYYWLALVHHAEPTRTSNKYVESGGYT